MRMAGDCRVEGEHRAGGAVGRAVAGVAMQGGAAWVWRGRMAEIVKWVRRDGTAYWVEPYSTWQLSHSCHLLDPATHVTSHKAGDTAKTASTFSPIPPPTPPPAPHVCRRSPPCQLHPPASPHLLREDDLVETDHKGVPQAGVVQYLASHIRAVAPHLRQGWGGPCCLRWCAAIPDCGWGSAVRRRAKAGMVCLLFRQPS